MSRRELKSILEAQGQHSISIPTHTNRSGLKRRETNSMSDNDDASGAFQSDEEMVEDVGPTVDLHQPSTTNATNQPSQRRGNYANPSTNWLLGEDFTTIEPTSPDAISAIARMFNRQFDFMKSRIQQLETQINSGSTIVNQSNAPQQNRSIPVAHTSATSTATVDPTVLAISEALKSIKVTAVSSTVPVPQFNSKKTTAEAYIKDVERYFCAQNHSPDQYIYMIRAILSPELKTWWDHIGKDAQDWNDFKTLFIQRYDNWFEKNERLKHFHKREQQQNEPTEAFKYEMLQIAKMCFPHETIPERLRRVQSAPYPRIRVALGPQFYQTPEELFQACTTICESIQAQDKSRGQQQSKLPPYSRGSSVQKKETDVPNSKDSTQFKTSQWSRGKNFSRSSRGGHRGRFQGTRPYHPSTSSQFASSSQPSDVQPRGQYRGRYRGNPRFQRGRGHPTSDHSNIQCQKCHGFGHKEAECSSSQGVTLPLFFEPTAQKDTNLPLNDS